MDDTKHPLQSLGIVGPLAAIVVLIFNHVKPGLGLTDADVAPAIDAGDAFVGCALGIIGRWRATQRISLSLLAALWLAGAASLSACSSTEIATAQADVNGAVAAAEPTIAMACWLAQAADAGFQIYAATPKADAAAVADEQKAMAGVTAICAAPPTDLGQAIAEVMTAYKAIVAETPQPAAASGA
jgi:hypothetical protein